MNLLDIVFIAILVITALFGMRMGLIQAALNVVFVFVGFGFAGQVSKIVGDAAGDSLSNDSVVTAVSYAVIVLGVLIGASIVARIVRPLLTVFTLGLSSMVDKLVGLALGLLIGVAISLAVLLGGARLTYDFDPDTLVGDFPGRELVGDIQIPQVEKARESLEELLTASQLVPIFITVVDAIPANMLGFVPEEFNQALDILEAVRDSIDQLE